MKEKEIFYFGYGANAFSDMMNAIIGRRPKGYPTKLENYALYVQQWNEIPQKAQNALKSWGPEFSSYIAVPLKGAYLWGTCWSVTQAERDIVGDWEYHHIWYTPIKVKVLNKAGKKVLAQTEMIPKYTPKGQKPITSKRYKAFVANKAKMLRVAVKSRKEYFARLKKQ